MKKAGWALLAITLACSLLALLFLSLNYSAVSGSTPPPGDWSTDNEDPCCPGDWDTTIILSAGGGGYITRSNVYVYEGNYSYEHFPDGVTSLWSHTQINCTVPITQGVYDAHVLFTEDPGHAGSDYYPFLAAANHSVGIYVSGWYIAWDFFGKRAVLVCQACDPNQIYWLGTIRPSNWHNYRVEWNLPPDPATGSFQVWMDDVLWVDESSIVMDGLGGGYASITDAGAGPWSWHAVWGDTYEIYVDDVQIYPCDEPWPDPTPTPGPPGGTADQYGHAAVLNVDADCSAVLRFNYALSTIPHDAVVSRATLNLYGVALEVAGETIEIAPLVPLWGEMTCDWCRRTVQESWAEPGAANVPLDRFPGKIAEFTAAIGWVEVDIPTYLVEEWILTNAANPGLVLSNPALTGKYSIASREWYVDDYQPYLTVWYED